LRRDRFLTISRSTRDYDSSPLRRPLIHPLTTMRKALALALCRPRGNAFPPPPLKSNFPLSAAERGMTGRLQLESGAAMLIPSGRERKRQPLLTFGKYCIESSEQKKPDKGQIQLSASASFSPIRFPGPLDGVSDLGLTAEPTTSYRFPDKRRPEPHFSQRHRQWLKATLLTWRLRESLSPPPLPSPPQSPWSSLARSSAD